MPNNPTQVEPVEGLVERLKGALPLLDGLETGQNCQDYAFAKADGFQAITYCPKAFEALRCIPHVLTALQSASEREAKLVAENERLWRVLKQIAGNNWKDQSRARFVARQELAGSDTTGGEDHGG